MSIADIAKYFRSNIFEALSSYQLWKMMYCSRSKGILSESSAEHYTRIQNLHTDFFSNAERAFLLQFIILVLHPFDRRSDSDSLYKIDQKKTEDFVLANQTTIESLRKVRNKIYAHRESGLVASDYPIPSVIDLDTFFDNLIDFYNELTKDIDDSHTIFDNARDVKYDAESLFFDVHQAHAKGGPRMDEVEEWPEKNERACSNL